MPPKPPHHHRHDARLASFIDRARIDRILAHYVPDEEDRRFVLRCLLDEGPAHHRGSNYILLALLSELPGVDAPPAPGKAAKVPLRVPPHLAEKRDDTAFPLPLPLNPLERLAPGDDRAQHDMIDCLTDGPPQHSLANAAMLCLIDAALRAGKP
jgi:hypothetical protein